MINFGAVPAGAVLPVVFDSYAGSTGASVTITGLAVTDIEIYKGTSMTQRASDAGYVLLDTDGIDIDGVTGIHGFSIDTGDNTDASFYAVGSFFTVVVSAITVDSQTVNFVAATFRLVAAETAAGTPQARASAIADGAISAATLAADTITAAKIADGAIDAGAIAADAFTAAKFAADVTTEFQNGLATQTSVNTIDDFLDTEIAAIKAKTDNLPTDPADASDIAAAIAALNDLSAAEVNAEVVDALATDTYAEPTGVPAATATLAAKISVMYMMARNGVTVTSTKKQFLDDGGAAEFEKDLSDDGTTYAETKANAP